jgi:hypothetical protein
LHELVHTHDQIESVDPHGAEEPIAKVSTVVLALVSNQIDRHEDNQQTCGQDLKHLLLDLSFVPQALLSLFSLDPAERGVLRIGHTEVVYLILVASIPSHSGDNVIPIIVIVET